MGHVSEGILDVGRKPDESFVPVRGFDGGRDCVIPVPPGAKTRS